MVSVAASPACEPSVLSEAEAGSLAGHLDPSATGLCCVPNRPNLLSQMFVPLLSVGMIEVEVLERMDVDVMVIEEFVANDSCDCVGKDASGNAFLLFSPVRDGPVAVAVGVDVLQGEYISLLKLVYNALEVGDVTVAGRIVDDFITGGLTKVDDVGVVSGSVSDGEGGAGPQSDLLPQIAAVDRPGGAEIPVFGTAPELFSIPDEAFPFDCWMSAMTLLVVCCCC